jgi:hypothetical protein
MDIRTAQTDLENALRDAILYALAIRIPPVASAAALRASPTRGAGSSTRSDDDLIQIIPGQNLAAGDSYRWSAVSIAADDGLNVIKPDDVTGNGRWLLWTSPLRFVPVTGGDSFYLHELGSGPLARVEILDKNFTDEEVLALLTGQVPAVIIEATDDDPQDATENVGMQWLTAYHFTISVITENLRDRRQAAQGAEADGDPDPLGANTIDGMIKSLLAGSRLHAVIGGVRAVRLGRGRNSISDLVERRVVRSREYTIQVTEDNPSAPNDTGRAQQGDYQPQMTDLHDQKLFDPLNFIAAGLNVGLGAGLVKTVVGGSAWVNGSLVNFTVALHTFGANLDTYRDLNPDGTMTFVPVELGDTPPPVTVGALRIGVTTTDGSSVRSDRYIATTKENYGPEIVAFTGGVPDNRVYWGVHTDPGVYDQTFVEVTIGGQGSAVATSRQRTESLNGTAGLFDWYWIPTSFGGSSANFVDENGNPLDMIIAGTVSRVEAGGATVSYTGWRSTQSGLGAHSMVVT